ncbi:universal stress protein [Cupriavidus sp. WKF15]|uniref:universal stress protein n=1 Tax=Cupriavidus sp. WKF15 TaxID=3032282 RepID=UPI0023E28643|nr:universal stress protein [Cupriavidus sp. WKF15]WER48929.1 universal stress protein [Cupriavidus sp. WKF15]
MYQRILVAVDGSQSASLAVDQAIILAKATGAEVKALFVVDDNDLFLDLKYSDPTDLLEKVMTYGQATLTRTVDRFRAAGIPGVTHLIERTNTLGLVADTIAAEADKWKADLIVLGTHGRRGFRRTVMGSVSEGVIRRTCLPVLLTRSEVER